VQVPLAVTAVTVEALVNQQINDTNRAVPSLTYQAGNNPGNNGFRIRGDGTQLFSFGVESAVSVVVDGIVAPRQAQGFSDLANLERVEVLRGSQGTLFGRNSTAGVINIVTERPSDTFGGHAEATVAEQDEYRATVTPMTAFQRYGGLDSRLFERRFGWGAAHANLQASLLGFIILIPITIGFPLMPTPTLALILIGCMNFFAGFNFGGGLAALRELTPKRMRALMSAAYMLTINLIGAALGPTVMALVTDYGSAIPTPCRWRFRWSAPWLCRCRW
jgi:hypothetical protein